MPTYGFTSRKTPSGSKVRRIWVAIPITIVSNKNAACRGFCSTCVVFDVNKLRCSKLKKQEGVEVHGVLEPQQEHQMQDGPHGDG